MLGAGIARRDGLRAATIREYLLWIGCGGDGLLHAVMDAARERERAGPSATGQRGEPWS
jgi:hypothetical protein